MKIILINNYDKNKLKDKIENLNNRLHKKPKYIKINFMSHLKIYLAVINSIIFLSSLSQSKQSD
jgi:hypothetical protein